MCSNILFLRFRGNIIGDSVRELALAEKYTKENDLKNKILYPCGTSIYNLFENNPFVKPILIPEFDTFVSDKNKFIKFYNLIKSFFKILQIKNISKIILLNQKDYLRLFLTKLISIKNNSNFKYDSFESALGYFPKLNFKDDISKYLIKNKKKNISICIESNELDRCWSKKNYINLINSLTNKYNVYLLGTDKKYCSEIIKKTNCINLIKKTTLKQTCNIIKNSNLYIGNDSGLVHLACAVETNTLVLINKLNSIKSENILNSKSTQLKLLNKPSFKTVLSEINKLNL